MRASRLLLPDTIRRIAEANPIVDVVGSYVPLKRVGANFKALCPFHREKTASFSVSAAWQRYRCFGCGAQGDVFGFVMLHADLGFFEAARWLAQRAGIYLEGADTVTGIHATSQLRPKVTTPRLTPRQLPRLPFDLHCGTRAELRVVAARRGLSVEGLALAGDRGLLWFGRSCGFPSWIVTDVARVNAQSRRLDGAPFPEFGDLPERKAHTLGGSQAGWPLGTCEAASFPFVLVNEGGPDLLAAHGFIAAEGREGDTAAITMFGAWNDFPEEALLILAHKRVRIYPHTDSVGQAAAKRWTAQLERVGCEVDAFSFEGLRRADGEAVEDLNDLAMVSADDFEAELTDLMEVLPR